MVKKDFYRIRTYRALKLIVVKASKNIITTIIIKPIVSRIKGYHKKFSNELPPFCSILSCSPDVALLMACPVWEVVLLYFPLSVSWVSFSLKQHNLYKSTWVFSSFHDLDFGGCCYTVFAWYEFVQGVRMKLRFHQFMLLKLIAV